MQSFLAVTNTILWIVLLISCLIEYRKKSQDRCGSVCGPNSVCPTCFDFGEQAGLGQAGKKVEELKGQLGRRDETVERLRELIATLESQLSQSQANERNLLEEWKADVSEVCQKLSLKSKIVEELEATIIDHAKAIAGRDEEIRSWIRTMNEKDGQIKELQGWLQDQTKVTRFAESQRVRLNQIIIKARTALMEIDKA